MLRRNRFRKCFFLSLMLIILTQCRSMPEIVQDNKFEQHEDVLTEITSNHEVCIYQKAQTDWVLTQEIETDTEILEVFLSGIFLIIEEEGFCLSLYKADRKMDSLEKEYEWVGRVQLNREEKIEAVEVKGKSLIARFQQATDSYDFSTQTWRNEKNERKMQTAGPTFEPFVHLSTESSTVYGMRLVGDYLIYTGNYSPLKLAKFDGSAFQSVFITPDNSFAEDVEFDMERKWLFQGMQQQVYLYADEGSGYQLKQAIDHNHSDDPQFMDLQSNYFLMCDYHYFTLYKWNGSQFNLEHNFTQTENHDFYKVKMCTDDIIIAPIYYLVDGIRRAAMRVYNTSNNYQIAQELFVEETEIAYTLIATDDCETVVLSPYFPSSPKNVYVLHRNSTGHFVIFNSYSSSRNIWTFKSCIHPDGDFFILPRKNGSDVWLRDSGSGDYAFYSTIGSTVKDYRSCAISHELIALGDTTGNVNYSLYYPVIEDPPEYGKKIGVQISLPLLLPQSQRKAIDIAFAGEYLVVAQQYSRSNAYKLETSSFSLDHTLDYGRFISSLDSEDSLQLLVQGSYDRTAYVYKDSGSKLSSVQNISTTSQIMAVDLDANGRLLLGHMNGDISEYSWNSSVFTSENKFPAAGSRIYGVKSCPKEEIVALKEQEGRFHLVLMEGTGFEKQRLELGQFVGVKFAVGEDCRRVFISSIMQMQVEVFVMQEGKYSLFRTVQEDFPLSDIAIHPQNDLFVVSRHIDQSSAVYRYDYCTEDYELEAVIEGDFDHTAVEMTDDRIVVADLDGKVAVYHYTFSLREVCSEFGQKKLSNPISDLATVVAERSIIDLDISTDLVVASSLYSGVMLFQVPQPGEEALVTTFSEIIFFSSVSVSSALNTFAVGTFNNSVLVYIDSGSGYQPNQTILTDSQVTSIDLSEENKLLVGMMNGGLAEYSSNGSSFSTTINTTNANSQVYAVQLCPVGKKVVILEAGGVFGLTIFPNDDSEPVSFVEELAEELIEPYLSVSEDCSVIAVSGVSMQKVQVFREQTHYVLFKSIQIGSPLSRVSVEEDGDLLIVPSIISPESYVYHYHQCTEIYSLIKTLNSGAYDESTAINSQYILQGNEDGTIKISEYSYIFNATCESIPIGNATNVRQKSSSNPETSNSEESEDQNQPLTTSYKNLEQLSSQGNGMSPGIIFLIVLGSVIVFTMFLSLIRWMLKKEPNNEENEEKATAQSAKQMQSEQTF